jgi:hypothetical protein
MHLFAASRWIRTGMHISIPRVDRQGSSHCCPLSHSSPFVIRLSLLQQSYKIP